MRIYRVHPFTSSSRLERFLDYLREGCRVREAAKLAGLNPSTLYSWREKDPGLREVWAEALKEGRLARRPAWLDVYLAGVQAGKRVEDIRREIGKPSSTLYRWLHRDAGFAGSWATTLKERRKQRLSWHEEFLAALSQGLTMREAAAAAKIPLPRALKACQRDRKFRQRWDEARQGCLDLQAQRVDQAGAEQLGMEQWVESSAVDPSTF